MVIAVIAASEVDNNKGWIAHSTLFILMFRKVNFVNELS
jgi:hypothetical protein